MAPKHAQHHHAPASDSSAPARPRGRSSRDTGTPLWCPTPYPLAQPSPSFASWIHCCLRLLKARDRGGEIRGKAFPCELHRAESGPGAGLQAARHLPGPAAPRSAQPQAPRQRALAEKCLLKALKAPWLHQRQPNRRVWVWGRRFTVLGQRRHTLFGRKLFPSLAGSQRPARGPAPRHGRAGGAAPHQPPTRGAAGSWVQGHKAQSPPSPQPREGAAAVCKAVGSGVVAGRGRRGGFLQPHTLSTKRGRWGESSAGAGGWSSPAQGCARSVSALVPGQVGLIQAREQPRCSQAPTPGSSPHAEQLRGSRATWHPLPRAPRSAGGAQKKPPSKKGL